MTLGAGIAIAAIWLSPSLAFCVLAAHADSIDIPAGIVLLGLIGCVAATALVAFSGSLKEDEDDPS